MNTNTIRLPFTLPRNKTGGNAGSSTFSSRFAPRVQRASLYGFRLLLAAVPALGIIMGSSWALGGAQSATILQATIWAAGFVFLALAVEQTQTKHIAGLLLTGLALPVLALLGSYVAVEFAVVGASLVAAWVAAAIVSIR
jgi:hypothetical protein